jgi:serine/threonine protein kinase
MFGRFVPKDWPREVPIPRELDRVSGRFVGESCLMEQEGDAMPAAFRAYKRLHLSSAWSRSLTRTGLVFYNGFDARRKKQPTMPPLEGTVLGRYRLTRLLGRGGMAEVYLASDDQLHREVAVKVVHLSREEDVARFRREAELLGPLAHEHILPVFDSGVQGPWHYLVMPYVSYGTLSQRLHTRGPLSPEEAGLLLEQIASALQYAHERGILHRDIKPSNILLRDETFAYVADFGIAKALSEERELTQAGMIMGTPEYMAPELLEHPASPSSDIYALGALLYDMLTGQPPFTGPTALAVFHKQVSAPPVPPSHFNPAISLPVEQVVLGALEKDPARRFPTPQALALAYHRALQVSSVPQPRSPFQHLPTDRDFFASPTLATTPPALASLSRRSPVRRTRALLIGGVLGALLLLVAAFWFGAHISGGSSNAPSQTPVTHASAPASPTATPTAMPSPTATSTPCSVTDGAHILDQTQVCQAVQTLSYPVIVYTTNTFAQGDGDFDRWSQSLVTSSQVIVIAINVKPSPGPGLPHVHVIILGGSSIPLTDPQYHQAMDAFNRTANTGAYTAATREAIQTLHTEGA